MSLADRLALLNKQSTSSSTSNSSSSSSSIVPGSLKSRIAQYDVAGASPLVPKGSFGQGLGKPSEGRGTVSREMIGNRIPSAGRGGFGVTPGSRSTSASQAKPGLSGAGWSAPMPRSRTTSTTNSGSASRSDSPSATDGLPPPLSAPDTTTNALPSSYLSATDPDAAPPTTAVSRSNSVLAQPSSTTSLSSMASIGSAAPSIASSYLPMNVSQQPSPPTAEQTGVPSVIEPDEDALVIGGGGGNSSRPASPVGSMMVEVSESIAPSMADSEEGEEAGSPADAPGTPRAEPVALPLDGSAAADSFAKLSLDDADGEREPEIEEAEHVPALEAKESEQASTSAATPDVGIETPPASAGTGSDAKEHGVDSWLDDVAAQNIAADAAKESASASSSASTKPTENGNSAVSPAAAGLAVPPTEEDGSVYFTPTLEFSSPEIPVSDMPSDEDDADRTFAAEDGSPCIDDVTGDTGLVTPKSATVTDFRALQEPEVSTPVSEEQPKPTTATDAAADGETTFVEATAKEVANLPEEPSPAVSEPTTPVTESASDSAGSASSGGGEGLSKEEREKRRRDKKRAQKKAREKRKKAAAAAAAAAQGEAGAEQTPMPEGKDLPAVPANEKTDAEADVKAEPSEPASPSAAEAIDRPATPPSSSIPFPIFQTPPVVTPSPPPMSSPPTVEQTPPTPTVDPSSLPPSPTKAVKPSSSGAGAPPKPSPPVPSSPTLSVGSPTVRQMSRSASAGSSSSSSSSFVRSKSPHEMDSDDEAVVGSDGGVKVRVISRERYS